MYNMREEPVLFVNIADDFVPYTIKTRNNLDECVITGKVVKEADLYEANIRKQASYCRITLTAFIPFYFCSFIGARPLY